jgi:UDP-N-acetylglucosamine transferase subunit ALG13
LIFLTVGTQLPFDRLVKMLDEWAEDNSDTPIFAQIGGTSYQPKNFEYCSYLDSLDYKIKFDQADVIVAHAGIGTILSCLVSSKSIIVFPRIASLGEHRNEHQLANCKKVSKLQGCHVAYDKTDFFQLLGNISSLSSGKIDIHADQDLLKAIETYIND